jgi:biotin carboxyl carrier protein
MKVAEEQYKADVEAANKEYSLGQITAEKREADLRAANATEYATMSALLSQKVILYASDTAAYQKALQQRIEFLKKSAQQEQQITDQAAAQQKKEYQEITSELTGPFTSALTTVGNAILDVGKKGQTWQQTMVKATQQIIQGFEKLIENIVLAIAKQELYNALNPGGGSAGATGLAGMAVKALGLVGGGDQAAAGAALTTAGTTLTAAGTILDTAGATLNTAAASLSAAAATMSAGGGGIGGGLSLLGDLPAFEMGGVVSAAGGMKVPSSPTLSLLHPDEMVLPADLSKGFQGIIKNIGQWNLPGGSINPSAVFQSEGAGSSIPLEIAKQIANLTGSPGKGGNTTNHNYHISVSSLSGKDSAAMIKQLLRDGHR